MLYRRGLPLSPTALSELPLDAWEPTKDTLHLYVQIVGKVRLASTHPQNHWWNCPLYVDVRGLTTRRMMQAEKAFAIDFDFVDHALVVRAGSGDIESFPLEDGLSVADFYTQLFDLLGRLGIEVAIRPEPFGVATTTPFAEDRAHASFDREWVERWWHALAWTDWVLQEFAGRYLGKSSPVHLFWHGLDLAVSRFSGARAAPRPTADSVTREAYSHEVISFGWWAGDQSVREATFYSYTAPEPEGLSDRALAPEQARWVPVGASHLAQLPYEVVRTSTDPRQTLLAFLESAYEAGADAAGWDREAFAASPSRD